MTDEEFEETARLMLQSPEGREQLLQIMRDIPITKEQMQATQDRLAKEHGKSMNDIVIEMICSGELDDVQMAECMEVVEGPSELTV